MRQAPCFGECVFREAIKFAPSSPFHVLFQAGEVSSLFLPSAAGPREAQREPFAVRLLLRVSLYLEGSRARFLCVLRFRAGVMR